MKRFLIRLTLTVVTALSSIVLYAGFPDKVLVTGENDVEVEALAAHKSISGKVMKYSAGTVQVILKEKNGGLTATLSSPKVNVKFVKMFWNEPATKGSIYLGDHWERGYGDLGWRELNPKRIMPWYYIETVKDRGAGDIVKGHGVMTGCRSFCSWKVSENQIELDMDVRNGTHGVALGRRKLEMATVIEFKGNKGESEYDALHRFCTIMCPSPRLPEKPVYGINDWYFAYGHNNEELIASSAESMTDLIPEGDNKPFYVIDAGWYVDGTKPDTFCSPNSNFPDMKRLADRMKKAGFRPGLWMRPLSTWENVDESWLLPPDPDKATTRFFDPTVPAVRDYIRKCFIKYHEWGYEMVKHDFSTYDIFRTNGVGMVRSGSITKGDWQFHDKTLTTAEVVLQLYKDIREAAGDDIYVIGCNTISHLSAGLFEIQRIGEDTSGREWGPTLRHGVNCLAFRAAQHNAFYSADADCVGLTSNVDWRLTEGWLRLVSQSGTALFVSPQPTAMAAEQRMALKEAFANAAKVQQTGEPLDWFDTNRPARWKLMGKEVKFDWNIPSDAKTPVDLTEGPIQYKLWRNLPIKGQPDFSKLGKPDQTGSIARPGALPLEWSENDVAILLTGKIRIKESADYEFEIGADSGAKLFIDGEMVVDNSGPHNLVFKKAPITLKEGLHDVRIEYYDDTYIQWLIFNYGPKGGAMRPVDLFE